MYTLEKTSRFKLYVYDDIIKGKELDLCESVDTTYMLTNDDTNIPIFKAYENNELGGSLLTLIMIKLYFSTHQYLLKKL